MRVRSIATIAALVLSVSVSGIASATITFHQIDDDVFVVSHRVKIIGSRAKAMEMVYTKAASLCIAAGYTHYRILQQESEASQEDDAANATVQVRFFREDGEDRFGCDKRSDPEYVRQAAAKLEKNGWVPAEAPSVEDATSGSQSTPDDEGDGAELESSDCTLEQVAAMARAGFTDDQIRAACLGDG